MHFSQIATLHPSCSALADTHRGATTISAETPQTPLGDPASEPATTAHPQGTPLHPGRPSGPGDRPAVRAATSSVQCPSGTSGHPTGSTVRPQTRETRRRRDLDADRKHARKRAKSCRSERKLPPGRAHFSHTCPEQAKRQRNGSSHRPPTSCTTPSSSIPLPADLMRRNARRMTLHQPLTRRRRLELQKSLL